MPTRFSGLVLRLLALASFIGGPLYCADLWKPALGDPWNFIAAFAPIALVLMAAMMVLQDRPTTATRAMTWVGFLGVAGLLCEDAFAGIRIAAGDAHPNTQMIQFGIFAGVCAAALYTWHALRFLRESA